MAELHLLGQIYGSVDFHETSLFCRYSFQSGPNWTVITGCPEGQTAAGKTDHKKSVFWSHPIDIHYVTKGIQGWPKIITQVNCLDSLGRSWTVGYGCCSFPTVPGHHTLNIPCWDPTANTLTDRLRQHFLGGSHQLMQSDIVALGADRFKLNTQSKGTIKLEVDVILRNFTQFGVEYK